MIALLQSLQAWYHPIEMDQFDLSSGDIGLAICLSLASLLFYSGIGFMLHGHKPNRLMWYFSALNSFTMLFHSIWYHLHYMYKNGFALYPISSRDYFEERDNFSAYVCVWILVANVWDIILSITFYPSQIKPPILFVYNSFAMIACILGITGIEFSDVVHPFSRGLLFTAIEEVPTCWMSLGYLLPSARSELVFGILYLVFRIFYHMIIFHRGIHAGCSPVLLFTALSVLLHNVHWFMLWFQQNGNKLMETTKAWYYFFKPTYFIPSNTKLDESLTIYQPRASESTSSPPSEPNTPLYDPIESKSAEEIAREDEELSRAAEVDALQQLGLIDPSTSTDCSSIQSSSQLSTL